MQSKNTYIVPNIHFCVFFLTVPLLLNSKELYYQCVIEGSDKLLFSFVLRVTKAGKMQIKFYFTKKRDR